MTECQSWYAWVNKSTLNTNADDRATHTLIAAASTSILANVPRVMTVSLPITAGFLAVRVTTLARAA